MSDLFLKLLNMSISAGWIALAVLFVRLVFRKSPKWLNVILWSFVGVRLILPFSFKSILSLIPSTHTIPEEITEAASPHIDSGFDAVNSVVNPIISESFAPSAAESVNPMQIVVSVSAVIWILGVAAMMIYAVASYVSVYLHVKGAIKENDIVMRSEKIDTPFILGIIKPKIYLPSQLSEEDSLYVLEHEKAHIKRKDYIWKPLAFALLSIYWFNPVLWAVYIFLCRDIEFACDEKVIKSYGEDYKIAYSKVLIACSVPRKAITACPVAFGEVGLKSRIKNILNYKKAPFWVIILSVTVCAVLAVCFLTDPIEKKDAKKQDAVSVTSDSTETVISEDVSSVKETTSGTLPVTSISEPVKKEEPAENKGPVDQIIKKLYMESFKDAKPDEDDVYVTIYKTFSDGSVGAYIDTYGLYNSSQYVISDKGVDTVIAGHKYKDNSRYDVFYIYKNGKLAHFPEAYSSGLISEKIVDEFFQSRQQFNENVELNGLPEKTARKIINDYTDGYEQDFCDIILKYKGTLSDSSILVFIDRINAVHAAVMVDDYIADEYYYTYSSGRDWTVYKNGQFKSIKNAYDTGLISKATLDELFNKYPDLNRLNSILNDQDDFGDINIKYFEKIKSIYKSSLYASDKNKYSSAISDIKNIIVKNCGTLSDGSMLLKFNLKTPVKDPTVVSDKIEEYTYEYKLGYDVRILCINGSDPSGLSTIKQAYESGDISKNVLDEIFIKLPQIE